jgi:virginiamycin B lyase
MTGRTIFVALAMAVVAATTAAADVRIETFKLPQGARAHDVAPAPDGTVWYTAQRQGALGVLDPRTGKTEHIALGDKSAPHGVIAGPDGAAWITDSGLNAIVRVDPKTREVRRFPLPADTGYTNLNTAAFDGRGILWFTGQAGWYGRVDPKSGEVKVWKAPKGRGPYGIAATPSGDIYYASLAGSHIAKIDTASGDARVIQPPTEDQGARRVWSDSKGRIWVSEWHSGQVSVFDPARETWRAWKLPGERPLCYAVYVDETDKVWLTDFGANAVHRFDPATEKFESFRARAPRRRSASSWDVRARCGRPNPAPTRWSCIDTSRADAECACTV